MANIKEIQDFAKRFLRKAPALAFVPANAQAIEELIRNRALLVIESSSSAVIMGRYIFNEGKVPDWIELGNCVRKDDFGEDRLAGYRIHMDAVKQVYYVKEI